LIVSQQKYVFNYQAAIKIYLTIKVWVVCCWSSNQSYSKSNNNTQVFGKFIIIWY